MIDLRSRSLSAAMALAMIAAMLWHVPRADAQQKITIKVHLKMPVLDIDRNAIIQVRLDRLGSIWVSPPGAAKGPLKEPMSTSDGIFVTTLPGHRVRVGLLMTYTAGRAAGTVFVSSVVVSVVRRVASSVIYGAESRVAGTMVVTGDFRPAVHEQRVSGGGVPTG